MPDIFGNLSWVAIVYNLLINKIFSHFDYRWSSYMEFICGYSNILFKAMLYVSET